GPNVPKRDLVGAIHKFLQKNLLTIPGNCGPHAAVLKRELETFVENLRENSSAYEADPHSKQHDDTVSALALAIWLGENYPEQYEGPLNVYPQAPGVDAAEDAIEKAKAAFNAGNMAEAEVAAEAAIRSKVDFPHIVQPAAKILEL